MSDTSTIGTNNVYADLGYADAADMKAKATAVRTVARSMREAQVTARDLAAECGVPESDLEIILRGNFRSFAIQEIERIRQGLQRLLARDAGKSVDSRSRAKLA